MAPRILLVEDDEGHAELVRLNLERDGVEDMLHFADGAQALDFLSRQAGAGNPFLVILDINMPGLDGKQVLKRLKESEDTRRIPVIMLTTTSNEQEIETCRQLGCDYYLKKPVDYDEFIAAMAQLGMFIRRAGASIAC